MKLLLVGLISTALFGVTPFADFEQRIADYMKIHKAAEADLGALTPTKSPAQLNEKKASISDGVRTKRANAAQGDIFTPEIATEFRKLIATNLKHRPRRIRQSIKSGEVVAANVHVNGSYPEGVPVETMPVTLLASFPKLPSDLDYRFIGSTLVLRDVAANLIIDLIPNAIVLQ